MVTDAAGSLVPFLSESACGLFCARGAFHIDPWEPVARALITHAHADHARPGSAAYLCAAPAEPLLRRRLGAEARIESLPYGAPLTLGEVRASFHPAGHVLGSAQIRLESTEGVWVVAGDYKRAADPTCTPFEPHPLRHLHHRIDVRASHLPLGSDGRGGGRHRELVAGER